MCGLYGIAGPGINVWDLRILEELAYVSGLRGSDSAGILQAKAHNYGNRKSASYFVEKEACDISYFKYRHQVLYGNKKVFKDVSHVLFAGHVRAATRGRITDDNAHPFDIGGFIGMHNGTLVDKKYQDHVKTDSELLIRDIKENKLIPVLKGLDYGSAYALVLYDSEENKLTFARNKDRTLFFCIHETRSVIYWASEEWMLRGVLGRNTEGILDDRVIPFLENKTYTLTPSEIPSKTHKLWQIHSFTPKAMSSVYKSKGSRKDFDFLPPFVNRSPYNNQYPHFNDDKKDSNIVILEDKRGKKDDKPVIRMSDTPKIPSFYCCGCQKRLTLVETHRSTKLSPSTYVCNACDADINALATQAETNPGRDEVIIN